MIKETAIWGQKGIKIPEHKKKVLYSLYNDAFALEKDMDKRCSKLLKESGVEVSDKHGEAIKKFFTTFYKSSIEYDSRGEASTEIIDKYLTEIINSLGLSKEQLIQFGITPLLKEGYNNSKLDTKDFALGNYNELHIFEGLFKGLKSKFGDKVTIIDTSPRQFGNSIRYDIDIRIDLSDKKEDKDILDIRLEAKKGIENNYLNSKFHLGTFSDTGFSLKPNKDVYESLYESLQKDFWDFMNRMFNSSFNVGESQNTISTDSTDNWMQEQLVGWSIEYIRWRLENNFPLFVSDAIGGQINLSSEIIRGFLLDSVGGKVEYIIKDMLRFVRLAETHNYNGQYKYGRYISIWGDESTKILQQYLTDSKAWVDEKIFQQEFKTAKISPLFKADVWYGKY